VGREPAGCGRALVEFGGRVSTVTARDLDEAEAERWWKPLTAVRSAFEAHHAVTGERTLFALEPIG
jgi:hypothetical protein